MTDPAAPPTGVTVDALCSWLAPRLTDGVTVERQGSERIAHVFQDARAVLPASLFVARPGRRTHGAQFAPVARERGAVAILTDRAAAVPDGFSTVLRVENVAEALAHASACVYGDPSRSLALVGVTGTNGKTSVAWALQRALEATGRTAARLGTLGFECAGHGASTGLTTAEADTTARCLRQALGWGAGHAAMEVSSVALCSSRVSGLAFAAVALTNLTQDHLDDHGSFAAYRAAKARLFLELGAPVWVVNDDDAFGQWLAAQPGARPRQVVRVGQGPGADLRLSEVATRVDGFRAEVAWQGAAGVLRSTWMGQHNVENMAVVLGCLLGLGLPLGEATAALAAVQPPPGRLERCSPPGHPFAALVDYAHTEDALRHILTALRPHTAGRLVCVFGCGGDRDPTKREPMGRAAGALADHCILTSDNPRTEDPTAIAAAVERGLRQSGAAYAIELDRAAAITRAVALAKPGDTVLVAGKGHETEQVLATGRVPFDDREWLRRAIAASPAAPLD